MNNRKLTPINRNNLFYSEEDFLMETDIVEGYIEEDLNQSVILYQVDRKRPQINNTYKESKSNVIYKPPKEIPCIFEIEDGDIKSYDNKTSNGVYTITGNLVFYVMPTTLKKYNCDVNRGDYIGVQIDVDRIYYFSVVNDGKVNTSNQHYIGAYKTGWRKIECAPTTLNEFNGQ